MSTYTAPRFSISPYFAGYEPGKPAPIVTKTLERLLSDAGSFGIYQIGVFLVLGLLAVVPSMVSVSFDFNVGTPAHRCRLSENDTFDKQSKIYDDFRHHTAKIADRSCMMFKNESSSEMVPCLHGWVFDMTRYGQTLTTELSLVCDKFHLRALTQNLFSAGTAGSLITGLLSDRWGRRKTIFFLVILLILSLNTMQLFLYSPVHQLLVFSICRFVQGFSTTFYSVSLVLLSELTGPSRRVLAANTLAYFSALGQILLAVVSSYLKDYKLTYWALNIYLLPFVLIYILIPESPRWLVQQNRVREARKVLERIFLINRRPLNNRTELFYSRLPSDVIAAREAQQNIPTYFNVLKRLCRSKLMRKRCLLLIAVWAAALSIYLGISSALITLTDQPHRILIASAISEMLGLTVCHILASVVERRRLLGIFLVATALVSALVPVTYPQQHSVTLALLLVGKLSASACQLLIVVYTTETYPTALRSTGVGLSACIARLVAMMIPQLSATQYSLWFPLPYVVYSTAAFLAALAASQLPSMHSPCKLPETVHEVEKQQVSTAIVLPRLEKTFDQRRPSTALIRELGVIKPEPVQPLIDITRVLPRRHSTHVNIGKRLHKSTRLSTIADLNEDEENPLNTDHHHHHQTVATPPMLSRIGSLPARLPALRRHRSNNLASNHRRSATVEFNLENNK